MNKVIEDFVLERVGRSDPTAGIALVGSRVRGTERPQDWDFVVVSTRLDIWDAFLDHNKDVSGISDDSVRFTLETGDVGVVPLSHAAFAARIDKPLNGQVDLSYKPWAIGAVAPEGFLGDIAQAHIIRDTVDRTLSRRQAQLSTFPDNLKLVIEQNTRAELHSRLRQLSRAYENHDDLNILVLKGQILFLIVRLLYANEGKYFYGSKHYKPDALLLGPTLNQFVTRPITKEWITSVIRFVDNLN